MSEVVITRDTASAIGAPGLRIQGIPASQSTLLGLAYVVLVVGAFCLYCGTPLVLETHMGLSSFGADSTLYTKIAHGEIEDRLLRFHPASVALAVAWVKITNPLNV